MRKRSVAYLGVLVAVWSCSSDAPVQGKAPEGDFNNPTSILGDSAGASEGSAGGGVNPNTNENRCVEGLANTSRVTPRVVLVLDGSCSMSTDYPSNGAQSATECIQNAGGRWAALRKALVDPQVGVVPKLQHVVQFGLAIFGTQPTCPIPAEPVQPALDNMNTIEMHMPSVQPGMYTPTGAALDWVYDNLFDAARPDDSAGPQIVILATDGEPNSCGGGGGGRRGGGGGGTNYQPSIDAVNKGTAKGITTYVLSLADATGDFHDHLQQLANLGDPSANGDAMLYEPATPEQLAADLQSLVGGAVGCDIALNGTITPGTECSGTVMLNGEAIECNGADGWKLVDNRHIELQGAACKQLMDDRALVEARFPCNSFSPD